MNNFTPRAQQVLHLAKREAERFNHGYIGSEHVLLGMLKLGQGVAITVMENADIETDALIKMIESSHPGHYSYHRGYASVHAESPPSFCDSRHRG